VPCNEISAEWGAQRIKGLSLKGVVTHFLKKTFGRKPPGDIAQKKTETSLIEKFLYPKFGPGQLWEHAPTWSAPPAAKFISASRSTASMWMGNKVASVEGRQRCGRARDLCRRLLLLTMPVRDLIRAISDAGSRRGRRSQRRPDVSRLHHRRPACQQAHVTEKDGSPLKDNWIYIQEPDVVVGRLQIFNNWSPWLVRAPDKVWIGLEYFCNDTDRFVEALRRGDGQLRHREIAKIGILKAEDVEDSHVVRVPKTYPAYFGSYDRFDVIRNYLDSFENLFLVGRNGMHKYNNQDHSMLTAMTAVENIVNGVTTKDNIWAINTEMEYHEEKARRQLPYTCPTGPFAKCPPAQRPLILPTRFRRAWPRPLWSRA
jgi:protoporphyrinogen oxidase